MRRFVLTRIFVFFFQSFSHGAERCGSQLYQGERNTRGLGGFRLTRQNNKRLILEVISVISPMKRIVLAHSSAFAARREEVIIYPC